MPDDIAIIPETPEQRQAAMLAFSAILGGGVLAYEIGRSIRDGDLLAVDKIDAKPEVGFLTMTAGLGLLGYTIKTAANDVGWKPLVLGGAGIFVFAMVARAIRG